MQLFYVPSYPEGQNKCIQNLVKQPDRELIKNEILVRGSPWSAALQLHHTTFFG